jgi:hypothetical protein
MARKSDTPNVFAAGDVVKDLVNINTNLRVTGGVLPIFVGD